MLGARVWDYQVVAFVLHSPSQSHPTCCPLGHPSATLDLLPVLPTGALTSWPALLQPPGGDISPGYPQITLLPTKRRMDSRPTALVGLKTIPQPPPEVQAS